MWVVGIHCSEELELLMKLEIAMQCRFASRVLDSLTIDGSNKRDVDSHETQATESLHHPCSVLGHYNHRCSHIQKPDRQNCQVQ